MNKKIITGALFCGALFLGTNVSSFAKSPQTKTAAKKSAVQTTKAAKHGTDANLTKEKAEAIALRKFPGSVERSTIETYKGQEVYKFNIEGKNGAERNVWVAKSGKVLKSEKEKSKKDRKVSKNIKRQSKT